MNYQLNTKFVVMAGLLTGLMFFVWGFAMHMSPLGEWTFLRFKNPTSVEDSIQKNIEQNGVYGSSAGLLCQVAFLPGVPNREVLLPRNLVLTLLTDLATGVLLAAFFDLFVRPSHIKDGAVAGAFLAATHFAAETLEGMIWYGYGPRFVVFETIDSLNLVAAGVLLTFLASKIQSSGAGATPPSSVRPAPGSSRKRK